MTIPLLNKSDSFQQIGLKIAQILAAETTHQQALATAAGVSATPYIFKVYRERSNPWEAFSRSGNDTPIINVWYDGANDDKSRSDHIGVQSFNSRFNIDIYVYADSVETSGGHTPGDEAAAVEAQRVGMMVRNILSHDDNRVLQITGDAKPLSKSVAELRTFQPRSGDQSVQNVAGFRVVLDVLHREKTDMIDEEAGEGIDVRYYYETDGQLIATLKYNAPEE
jgi:hypothetical protein